MIGSMGMAVHGFPNMVMLYGPQSTASFCNGPVCAELQGDWVADFLEHLRAKDLTEFESTQEIGLAWTSMGGDTLYVEAAAVEQGEGKVRPLI